MPINIHSLKKIPPLLESQLLIHEYRESEAEMKKIGLKDKEQTRLDEEPPNIRKVR